MRLARVMGIKTAKRRDDVAASRLLMCVCARSQYGFASAYQAFPTHGACHSAIHLSFLMSLLPFTRRSRGCAYLHARLHADMGGVHACAFARACTCACVQ